MIHSSILESPHTEQCFIHEGTRRNPQEKNSGIALYTDGCPRSYASALSAMENRVAEIITGRASEALLFTEHPGLYTMGSSARASDIRGGSLPCPVIRSSRGGKTTWHGPGQRIVYLMFNLRRRKTDLHRFVHGLEVWFQNTFMALGAETRRLKGRPGLWAETGKGEYAKILALGLRIRRGVCYHGVSINIDPDLRNYEHIIACGAYEPHLKTGSLAQLGVTASTEKFDEQAKHFLPCFLESLSDSAPLGAFQQKN